MVAGLVQFQLPTVDTFADLRRTLVDVCELCSAERATLVLVVFPSVLLERI
jgi:hypothetical protein